MNRFILLSLISILSISPLRGQESGQEESKYLIGFNGVLPSGIWPATALSNMGSGSFLSSAGHNVKSYGMGVVLQRKITSHFNLVMDMNMYDYNIFLANAGDDVQTSWTTSEGALHWDEPDAPQILYVHNLPTDVLFDMQATGVRIGARYLLLEGKTRPWIGAGYGYYMWTVNYYNGDKTQTYGSDNGSAMGVTFQAGVDLEIAPEIVLTLFVDAASPVANYQIEGLFYDQWNIDWDCHIMGTTRYGISLSFAP